ELVLERQVEAALAGIALPPGAAAQLVVDPAALVALGAEHVEPTELAHLRAVLDALDLELLDELLVLLGRLLDGGAARQQLGLCESFGVAAEQDVDAATGHVGGH